MAESPFANLTVLDASESVAGQFAARIFADYGADVLLVEPSGGSVTRRFHPSPASSADGQSPLFAHLNGGKQSVVVDVASGTEREAFLEMCAGADVVIVGSAELADEINRTCAAPIVAVVSDFSASGPYADWTGSEIVHQALSGSMFYTGLAGREPLYGAGRRASYSAGVQTYISLAASLHQRLATGTKPRQVSVSVHEAGAAMEQNFSTQFGYNGSFPERGEQTRPKGRALCKDGWVVYFVRANQWPEFCRAFRATELIDDPRFATWVDLVRNWAEAANELHERGAALTIADLAEAADRDRLVLAPVMTIDGLLDEEHLRGREFWEQVDVGDGTTSTALGPLFRFSSTPCTRDRAAPDLGSASRRPSGATSDTASDTAPTAPTHRPLRGVRVLDFSSAWAGPMATRILATLGADIVKIEGPARPDAWRGEPFDPPGTATYPDFDPGDRPYNRHAWFNSQNHDKRAVSLDIKQPAGLDTVKQLVAKSDIVLANWSPGALARSGLGYADLREINERIIVVEMPAISSTGPLANQRGLGPTMEAMSGITSLIGYHGGAPIGSGSAYLDPTGGVHGAAAALTALLHRDLTGEGQHVEVAQREAAMHWIGELFLDAAANGSQFRQNDNGLPWAAPHGAYPTSGTDEWIAIGVETDDQWHALTTVLADDALLDERFATTDGRIRWNDDLTKAITRATETLDKHEFAARLQAAGVPAAPVQNGRDLFQDPHLRAAGWFTELGHDDVGTHEYPGLPLVLDGVRLRPSHHSPRFGEHTVEVLCELLDMNIHDVTDLENAKATTAEPRKR